MLTQAVATLTAESAELRKKVERLSQLAFAAGVVGAILLVIFGFAANKIADAVIATMKSASH
jgi:EamA domain-containing membrane protein RarD